MRGTGAKSEVATQSNRRAANRLPSLDEAACQTLKVMSAEDDIFEAVIKVEVRSRSRRVVVFPACVAFSDGHSDKPFPHRHDMQ
jgi:hypothetical protein